MTARPLPIAASVAAVAAAAVLAPSLTARMATVGARHPIASGHFEPADAALVLGARVWADGRPSRYLRERVMTGVRLYHAGLVSQIIMSGAGKDSSGHGEPGVMRRVAEEAGVPPTAIIEDPLGVDTYSSCVRARDEYGMRSVIVATQEFHLPRAVWLCERLGLAAQGAYPRPFSRSTSCTGTCGSLVPRARP